MNALKHWLTTYRIRRAERAAFAAAAGISTNALSQYVNGHRPVTVPMAARLEAASLRLPRVRYGSVPVLVRGALCDVCARCPYHPVDELEQERVA